MANLLDSLGLTSPLLKQDYLNEVLDWEDDNIPLLVEEYEGYTVVSDPLPAGSKVRFCDHFVKTLEKDEIVFGGGNPLGLGPAAMSQLSKKYGKKCTFFFAARKEPTIYQQMAIDNGANIIWVQNGMLAVTKARAREYTTEDPKNRYVLPLGLEHPTVIGSIIKVFENLKKNKNLRPVEVWSVGSSGTINRGLQFAFEDVPVGVVQIGHALDERETGRAKKVISPYKWNQEIKAKDKPPFPSPKFYDAKGWTPFKENAPKGSLFFNVSVTE